MEARIKQLFNEFIKRITKGSLQINRIDLHEVTFKEGYEKGYEDAMNERDSQ